MRRPRLFGWFFDWWRGTNEQKVHAALMVDHKGYSVVSKVKEITGEMLEDPKSKEPVYTGVMPHIVEFGVDVFPLPIWVRTLWFHRKWRIRMHKKLAHEPFTRDIFTGKILNQDKKMAVLREKGVIDADGYLLDKAGDRVRLYDDEKDDAFVYIKVDVSDIDYIKAEYKSVMDSGTVQKGAEAMAKTGKENDRNMFIVLLGALIFAAFVVFITAGGFGSLGL